MTLGSVTSTGGAPAPGGIDPTPSEASTDRAASGFELLLSGARSATTPVRDERRNPGETTEPEARPADESNASDASDPSGPRARGNDLTETERKPSATTDTPTDPPDAQPSAPPAEIAALLAALAAPAPPPQSILAVPTASDPAAGPDSPPITDPAALPAPTVLDLAVAALSLSSLADPTPAGAPPDLTPTPAPATPAPVSHATPAPPTGPAAGSGPVPRLDHTSAATAGSATNGTANATSTPATVDSAGPPPSDRPRPPTPLAAVANGAATFAATAPAPTATAGAADATATTAAVAPPPPAEQLVSVLTPMRTAPNGTYTLRLELKPPELGRVEMRVEMRDGVLHASIHADHEGSAQLVRDALSELRDRLDAEGVRTGELTVSDGGVGNGSHDNRDASAAASPSASATPTGIAPTDDPGVAAAIQSALPSDTTSLLDVRV